MTRGRTLPDGIIAAAARIRAGDTSWLADIACRGQDLDLFFPERGSPQDSIRARAICSGCPVRLDCLAEALLTQDQGIRGGLTWHDRVGLPTQLRTLEAAS